MPTPTYYRGIEFRSKLEADWANYLDFLDINWAYEPEAFTLSNGAKYLPDFYLPLDDMFVEVRGTMERSLRRVALFLKESKRDLLVALPRGRFFVASLIDAETGQWDFRFVEALFGGDEAAFKQFRRARSCVAVLDADAVGARRAWFANYGDSSEDYCGQEPDWYSTERNGSRVDGGDARVHYWGGESTWEQRGFTPTKWMPAKFAS